LLRIACALADALVAAHARHIIHRDLKPANIMITATGVVKVLDFDLARILENPAQDGDRDAVTATESRALTRVGAVAGTPGYMSPEQIRGVPVDHRTDIFSLGLVLYEMATGSRTFSGPSRADIQSATLRDDPTDIASVRAELPRHLSRIVSQCLEKPPELRPQTAVDLRNQLYGLRKELESDRILGKASRTDLPPQRQPIQWSGWMVGLVAALAVVVGAGLVLRPWDQVAESRLPTATVATAAVDAPMAIAVIPFRNLTDDPDLEWLRSDIPQLLVTALSQRPSLDVMDSGATRRLLAELDIAETPDPPAEQLQSFAQRAGVAQVLRGSFSRLGDSLRVNVEVLNGGTGRVVTSSEAEGEGDASLFATIDLLSEEVLAGMGVSTAADVEAAQDLNEVTTASVEALRYYTEGSELRVQQAPRVDRDVREGARTRPRICDGAQCARHSPPQPGRGGPGSGVRPSRIRELRACIQPRALLYPRPLSESRLGHLRSGNQRVPAHRRPLSKSPASAQPLGQSLDRGRRLRSGHSSRGTPG